MSTEKVPPLEGLWWQDGANVIDYSRKEDFEWISMIRLPEFVTKEEFAWAVAFQEICNSSDNVLHYGLTDAG